MYMIQYLVCRDMFSYDKLAIENTVTPMSLAEYARQFDRACRDYQQYLERREDSVSMVRIIGYNYNPERKSWDMVQEWERKIPLKKITVVNPDLEAKRALRGASSKPKQTVMDVFAQVAAMNPMPQAVPVPVFDEVEEDNDD